MLKFFTANLPFYSFLEGLERSLPSKEIKNSKKKCPLNLSLD